MSKEYDENTEYYHELYGNVIACEEEELDSKADDADNGKGIVPKLSVGKWTLLVKQSGRVLKAVQKGKRLYSGVCKSTITQL